MNQESVDSIPLPKRPKTNLDSEVPDPKTQRLSNEEGRKLKDGEDTNDWNGASSNNPSYALIANRESV